MFDDLGTAGELETPGDLPIAAVAGAPRIGRIRDDEGLDVQAVEVALGGKVATEIWEGERKFGVVVRLPEEERKNVRTIRSLMVDAPGGRRLPLEEVADIFVQSGSMNISREAGSRVAAIGVFIRGRDMGSIVEEMRAKVSERVSFPPGYYATFGGEFENQERAMRRLELIVPVSSASIVLALDKSAALMPPGNIAEVS